MGHAVDVHRTSWISVSRLIKDVTKCTCFEREIPAIRLYKKILPVGSNIKIYPRKSCHVLVVITFQMRNITDLWSKMWHSTLIDLITKLLFFVTQNSTKHHWKTAFMCLRGLWRNWRKPGRERAGWSSRVVGRFVSSIKPQSLSLSHSNINKKSTDLWIYDNLISFSGSLIVFSYIFFRYDYGVLKTCAWTLFIY